jgi:hypothetical protein
VCACVREERGEEDESGRGARVRHRFDYPPQRQSVERRDES